MAWSGFQAVSHRICAEKSLKHTRTAEVQLSILDFLNSSNTNSNNVKRLIRLFKNQHSYSPAEQQHHILAVINTADLYRAVDTSRRDRVEASREVSQSEDISNKVKRDLIEEYLNKKKLGNSVFFLKI
ncbi:hypothetical protein A9K55_003633 [Cordyceps militaris]|uniref:Uncharacterized protein n=1 Tax=Cordyceps militaris TaxID=73501 RepID=A0A2H4S576_CORMI|nr:hypothetical protein A9K55_003633 [Cordyceps militaris]